MPSDIVVDPDGYYIVSDGDIVFARVIGSRIVEFITFANSR